MSNTLTNYELSQIRGGAALSGTLINSISKMINTLLDLGRAIGSAIRRSQSGTKCAL